MATNYRNDFYASTQAFMRTTGKRHKSMSALGYNTYQDVFASEDSDSHGPSKITRLTCHNGASGDITFLMSMQAKHMSSGKTFQLYSKVPIKSQSIFLAIGNSNPFYLDGSEMSLQIKFDTINPYSQSMYTGILTWYGSIERWYQ